MSDKIEREVEEILNRLDRSGEGQDVLDGARGFFRNRTANLRRAIASRLAHIPRRQIMLASLVLVVLVAAGLFFGLTYPSLSSSGSGGGEVSRESAGDQIGERAHVDEARPEGSVDEGTDTEGQESEHEVDRSTEEHGEHDRDGGEQH